LKGRDHLEDLGIDGGIILKWTLRKSGRRVWIGLNEDSNQWQAFVNTLMYLWVP
jgi:hypothetical protein